jgi:methionine sulfoxide reductase heme-binding subunit
MATAYVAFALFVVTLSFGPLAAIRGRRYPASTDQRRDFAIWSAVVALVHVVVGLQVHLRGKMEEYFLWRLGEVVAPRVDPFGFANYTGLVAMLLFVVLLATSNDASMRRLGLDKWRRVHRLTYWALGLTLAHGVAYQAIEKRALMFVLIFSVLATFTIALQYLRRVKQAAVPPA